MAESIMRQELTSWLKAECQGVGLDMIHALYDINWARDEAGNLMSPRKYLMAVADIKTALESANSEITKLPLELLTAEERQEIFNLKDEINSMVEDWRSRTEYEVTRDIEIPIQISRKLAALLQLTEKYLLEKVVECQCGKTESSRQETVGIIGGTLDVVKGRMDWLYKNQFASFLLYRDSIDEAVESKEAGRIPKTETLKPFTLDELRSLKEYADELYYKPHSSSPTQEARFTKGQPIVIKSKAIYEWRAWATVERDDPEHNQVWVKEIPRAVKYEDIEEEE